MAKVKPTKPAFASKAPNAPKQPIPVPKAVNVGKIPLQVGPVKPKPGSMLIEKRRKAPK